LCNTLNGDGAEAVAVPLSGAKFSAAVVKRESTVIFVLVEIPEIAAPNDAPSRIYRRYLLCVDFPYCGFHLSILQN
jgi:hypothetical protein